MDLVLFDFKQTLVSAKHPQACSAKLLVKHIYHSALRGDWQGTEEQLVELALKDDALDFRTRTLSALGCYPQGLELYQALISDDSEYDLWPDTLLTLTELKEAGYSLGVYNTSEQPEQLQALLQALQISQFFEYVFTDPRTSLAETAEALRSQTQSFASVTVVGDSLYKEVAVANTAGFKSIWLNLEPAFLSKNTEAIRSKDPLFKPSAAVTGLLQVPGTLEYLKTRGEQTSVQVGYYFPNKRRKLEVASKKAFVSNARIVYTPILLGIPVDLQGHFQVIVQKVSDIFLSRTPDNLAALANLLAYLAEHPQTVLVDPLEGLEVFVSREQFASLLREVHVEGITLRSPRHFSKESVEFPVTIKTNAACQVDNSHLISFVRSEAALQEALKQYSSEVVCQEYVIHSGQVYKVSVLGQYVQLDVYKSPFFDHTCPELVTWDSAQSLPLSLTVAPVPPELTQEAVRALAEAVRQVTHFSLLSFDIVVDLRTQDLVIVDLNYFPSFRNIPDLPLKFEEHLLRMANKDD
jgi:inositol-1,3,4-trisphosphate 5/6-kinase/inositol-tetrakisphosphate 1-kinase